MSANCLNDTLATTERMGMKSKILKSIRRENARKEKRTAFDDAGHEHIFQSKHKADRMKKMAKGGVVDKDKMPFIAIYE